MAAEPASVIAARQLAEEARSRGNALRRRPLRPRPVPAPLPVSGATP
ncbi:hypothetical protein [Modestobacter sp. SYSU DS0657]